jgi:hypothetical protein
LWGTNRGNGLGILFPAMEIWERKIVICSSCFEIVLFKKTAGSERFISTTISTTITTRTMTGIGI